ncbi:hypothetical protein G4228_003625 [Cervus hanglu yarkandensis]|nr:hypothetical protein G4228_003625 [Cervus hanglu yarkandensis]
MDRLSPEQLNPSIYVGLRLSSLQAGAKEAHYLHSLKLSYQQSLLRPASSKDGSDSEAKPSMGQLALYLLALRANCEFVGGRKGDRLVSQLKRFLEDEKGAIGHNHQGHPRTSYYQYGLGILALCVHQKRVHDSVVGKLLYAVEHERHLLQDGVSVALLEPATEILPQTQVPEFIDVTLEVSGISPSYRHSVSVPAGSSLEDVLKNAQEHGRFRYRTQASLSGPFLTSVLGKKAGEREFWQVLQAPDTPLQQGIADYRPKDGETIELRLVGW